MKKVLVIALLLVSTVACRRSTDVNAFIYIGDGVDSASRDSVQVIVHDVPTNIRPNDVITATPDSSSTTEFNYMSDRKEPDTGDGKPQVELTVIE